MTLPPAAFDTFVWMLLAAIGVLTMAAWKLVTPKRPLRAAGEPVSFGATAHALQGVPVLSAIASSAPAAAPAQYEQLLDELAQQALRLQRLESLVERMGAQVQPTPLWKRPSGERLAECLYAEVPDASGTFLYDALKLKPEASSLFEIRPSTNKRTAAVTLCGTPDIHRQALRNQKRFLQPVCDYADLPRYTHTKIVVTKPGRAERQDTGWRVTIRIGINFG